MSMSSSSNSIVYSPDKGGYSSHDALVLLGICLSAIATATMVIVLFECFCRRRRNTIVYVAARPFYEHRGHAHGLSPSAVAALPSFRYGRSISDGSDNGRGWAQCAVCINLVQQGELVRQLPKCKHLFHVGCIDMWLYSHSTCPLCRATVEPELRGANDKPPPV